MTDEYIDDSLHGGPEPVTDTPDPVPVIDVTESAAPEFGGVQEMTVPVSGGGGSTGTQPAVVQLLQRRKKRKRARIWIDSLGTVTSAISAGGTFVVPAGPGTVISSFNAPVTGLYTISVATALNGPSQPDRNNMQLNYPGGSTILPSASGGDQQAASNPVTVPLKQGDLVSVTQIAAAGTSTGYSAIITADYTGGGATAVVINANPDPLTSNVANPSGGYITAVPRQIIWESQRPLYAVALGGPVNVYVQDESYAEQKGDT